MSKDDEITKLKATIKGLMLEIKKLRLDNAELVQIQNDKKKADSS